MLMLTETVSSERSGWSWLRWTHLSPPPPLLPHSPHSLTSLHLPLLHWRGAHHLELQTLKKCGADCCTLVLSRLKYCNGSVWCCRTFWDVLEVFRIAAAVAIAHSWVDCLSNSTRGRRLFIYAGDINPQGVRRDSCWPREDVYDTI